MPKGDSADRLLKRLQKIERAQARLGDITTRIRAQSETLAELLKVAQGFVDEKAIPKPAVRVRSAAPAPKPTTANRAAPKRATAAKTSRRRTTRPVKAAQASATRRAPRKPASA